MLEKSADAFEKYPMLAAMNRALAEKYADAPLNLAISMRRADIVRELLEGGVDPNKPAGDEYPISVVVSNGDLEIGNLLVAAGADVNLRPEGQLPVLFFAILREKPEIIRFLVNNGADLEITNKAQETALHTAARFSDSEVARILVEAGADKEAKREDGKTPREIAEERGDADLVRVLF